MGSLLSIAILFQSVVSLRSCMKDIGFSGCRWTAEELVAFRLAPSGSCQEPSTPAVELVALCSILRSSNYIRSLFGLK